jgi:hypothetical protein
MERKKRKKKEEKTMQAEEIIAILKDFIVFLYSYIIFTPF